MSRLIAATASSFTRSKNSAETTRRDVLATVARHYPFLAEMLLYELSDGKKLFVYRPETPDEPIVRAYHLMRAMRRIGPATLLWVTVVDDPGVVGTTHWILPGQLMIGHLDRYAPLRFAAGLSFEPWLQVCLAAMRLRAASPGHTATAGPISGASRWW